MKKMLVLLVIGGLCVAFTSGWDFFSEEKPVYIPPSIQRTGNPDTGFIYLTTGDYLKSGIPLNYFKLGFSKGSNTYLQRDGINREIPYEYTAVKASNGEIVIAPNCLQCHASIFDNKLYIGLGNTTIDFSANQKLDPKKAETAEELLKNLDPKKFEAAEPFLKVVKTIGGKLSTSVRGVNSADRLAALLAAHRDRNTFKWSMEPLLQVPDQVVPTDVPAWWLLKKKHAMFYNGFGRGDFSRFLMASNLLTVNDTAESREVDSHFSDVLAYIYTLKPPPYPGAIDRKLARTGGQLYIRNCSKCHGNYGTDEGYPNLLIPESVIQTDSILFRSNYQSDQFIDWFNTSWFAKGDHPARLEPFNGYIAPPLDGIWITAPYFHNGSVPTLEGVLNSRKRPAYWARDFNDTRYDLDRMAWPFEERDKPEANTVYNTTLPGYGNYGHYFGDKLSDKERKAIIEYLKTL